MLLRNTQGLIKFYLHRTNFNPSQHLLKQYHNPANRKKIRTTTLYWSGVGVLVLGLSYAAVPLYRVFCQSFSYGGTLSTGHDSSKVEIMLPVKNRMLNIKFISDVSASMVWDFRPQQHSVKVRPGETALAFYTATNPTDRPICGISTYNVLPFEAGQYFNKIQCFCFEEQRLNPHEQVDLPVFFYIDPDINNDPQLENVHEITLSYTFFEAKNGLNLPVPSYVKSHTQAKSIA